jgi:ABC-type Mn2+/Zn2+ transport system permease subunit
LTKNSRGFGIRADLYNTIFLPVALTVVLLGQVVGIILVVALLPARQNEPPAFRR